MRQRFPILDRLLKQPWFAHLWQFAKFAAVGASNTLISLAVYEFCVNALDIHYIAADAIGLCVSVINAYYWNNRVVFGNGEKKSMRQHIAGYFRSLAAYGGTFLLDIALLSFWIKIVGLNESIAPLLNLIITIPLNFLINKFWTFGKKNEPSVQTEGK